jgi:hypothetical protein
VQTVDQTVTVSTAAPVLQLDSSDLAEVIDNRQVDKLPLNGRDFRKLAFSFPASRPLAARFAGFLHGQRPARKVERFPDRRADNNDSFRNQPSFNQGGPVNAPATILPVDALAEFSIQTQGSAEYGRNSGAIVNTVLKSGTNQVHGTAYEYLRHDKLNSRNFFETLPGSQKSPFKNSNFGGTLPRSTHDRTLFSPPTGSAPPEFDARRSVPATRPSAARAEPRAVWNPRREPAPASSARRGQPSAAPTTSTPSRIFSTATTSS